MSDFNAKCTQVDFRCGSAPDPAGGAYSAPPDPIAAFNGAYFRRRTGGWDRKRNKGKEGQGRRGKRGEGLPKTQQH